MTHRTIINLEHIEKQQDKANKDYHNSEIRKISKISMYVSIFALITSVLLPFLISYLDGQKAEKQISQLQQEVRELKRNIEKL